MSVAMPDIHSLIERVEAGERSNSLDVLIEVASFEPTSDAVAIRANCAGTKVIYTDSDGKDHTHWAFDWTAFPKVSAMMLKDAVARTPVDGGE